MVRLGNGRAKFNHVYVTNVAHAHVLAAESLTLDSPVAGQCYFITDHPASNFYDFFVPYLQALGYSTKMRRMPYALARMLAVFSELFARSGGKPITDFLQGQLPISETGCLVVDKEYQTALPGVYAVGDVLCNHVKQAVIAAAEGAVAAIAIEKNLHHRKQ
jgi:hypothetical protein